jgi:hypothetical protein
LRWQLSFGTYSDDEWHGVSGLAEGEEGSGLKLPHIRLLHEGGLLKVRPDSGWPFYVSPL